MYQELLNHTYGVTVEFPEHFGVIEDEACDLKLYDERLQVTWLAIWRPGLSLDLCPAHREHLETRLERYARHMFDCMHEEVGEIEQPRTADASWSPMVDVEYVEICGLLSLVTLHRMIYEPTHTYLLGHIQLPLEGGLLELRACIGAGGEEATARELVLYTQLDDHTSLPPQSYYDSREHDARFDTLVLSRVRRAMDDMITRITSVSTPLRLPENREITLDEPACMITPPARFILDEEGYIDRVSFCATDGLEVFQVLGGTDSSDMEGLHELIARTVFPLYHDTGVSKMHVYTDVHEDTWVEAVAINDGDECIIRDVYVGWLDARGIAWIIGIRRDKLSPVEELVQELIESARTLRTGRKKWFGLF